MDSTDVRRLWAERSGEYSPDYYAHRGSTETSESIRRTVDRALPADPAILELGCSAGRHLAHLHDHGYGDLHGVDLNPDAAAVMADRYPDLADAATVHVAAIEDLLPECDDDRFDAVYSVETLQHVHPDADRVFAEVARVTSDLLVTVENEREVEDGEGAGDEPVVECVNGVPLYYRDWHRVFTDLGLTEVGVEERERDTMRVFRVEEDRQR